jgi:hypothetical protein
MKARKVTCFHLGEFLGFVSGSVRTAADVGESELGFYEAIPRLAIRTMS